MPDTENTEINELIADVREQVLYLHELGVESFQVENGKWKVESAEVARPVADPIPDNIFMRETPKPPESRPAGSRLASLPSLSKRPTSASEAHEKRYSGAARR